MDENKSNGNVILFDVSKLSNSQLKSKYLLYDKQSNCTLHFGIAIDNNKHYYYPETFIVEDKKLDRYVEYQDEKKLIT